jgi:formylglycine-generating enzyme required for sulfatase activity
VINVTWDDAQRYVAWLSKLTGQHYRLLSEAGWEYAARAGTQTNYPWGDKIGDANANCTGCGGVWDGKYQPVPVGSFPANQFGLSDMHGNVWEWVEDCYQASYDNAPRDGSARTTTGACSTFHVLRGASWYDAPAWLRSALRNANTDFDRVGNLGIRVGRSLAP